MTKDHAIQLAESYQGQVWFSYATGHVLTYAEDDGTFVMLADGIEKEFAERWRFHKEYPELELVKDFSGIPYDNYRDKYFW